MFRDHTKIDIIRVSPMGYNCLRAGIIVTKDKRQKTKHEQQRTNTKKTLIDIQFSKIVIKQ